MLYFTCGEWINRKNEVFSAVFNKKMCSYIQSCFNNLLSWEELIIMESQGDEAGRLLWSPRPCSIRTLSSWVLSISKDGEGTTSLFSLFQRLNILTVGFLFWWVCLFVFMFKCRFMYFSLHLFPLFLSLDISGKSLLSLF